jgi:hypothetical protein
MYRRRRWATSYSVAQVTAGTRARTLRHMAYNVEMYCGHKVTASVAASAGSESELLSERSVCCV